MKIVAPKALIGMVMVCLAAGVVWSGDGPAGNGYRISGTVVNSVTHRPLGQVRVQASADDGSPRKMEALSGPDGKFVMEQAPAGSWTLVAERKGFVTKAYGQRDAFNTTAISIVTGAEGVSEGLVFPLDAPAAISGRVTDERGEPVVNAIMHLLVVTPSVRQAVTIRKVVATDDAGEYRMWDLPPATCYLEAVVPPNMGVFESEPVAFAPQFYANTGDARSATPIQLQPGDEFSANFMLRRAQGVSVTVDGNTGIRDENNELMVLIAQGPAGSEVSAGTLGPGSGRSFTHVPPGRYKLVIGDMESTYATSKWVEVGTEDLTVKVPFANPPEVTAKVRVVDGDPALLKSAMLRIGMLSDAGNNMRPLQPDGTAHFPAQAAGRYQVSLITRQLYVRSITAQSARVADGMVELPEAGPVQLEITAAGDGARIRGRVRAGNEPVSGALVVLAPRKESANPDDTHGYQSDSDGSFDFACVKPGEYLLFATNDWPADYGSAANIRSYLRDATPVKAAARGAVEVQLAPLHR